MDATVRPRRSLNTGLVTSVGIHVLIAAYIVVSFSNPQPLGPPTDLSNAIPISMELFRPEPPPEPPKPVVKPKAPKDVVTTTAPEPDMEIAEEPEDAPPAPPTPPQEPATGAPSAPSYASIVAGILQRSKRYPRDALANDIQGVVDAYFVVNHQGHVIAYRIEQGSGEQLLDAEVIRLLKHVRFPPIPDDGGDPQRREFRLPIQFRIKG